MEKRPKPLALLTGGSGYIGSAIVHELEASGWHVVSLPHKSTESIQRLVSDAVERFGPISACIHAAAPTLVRKPILTLSEKEFDEQINVALHSAFALANAAAPHMQPGSVFIGITTAALESNPPSTEVGSYTAAKAGLRGLLRSLSEELRPLGIRVNAVAPGFLPGGLNRDLPEKVRDFLTKKTGSVTDADVARVVAKLCEDGSAFPTGTSIRIPAETISPL